MGASPRRQEFWRVIGSSGLVSVRRENGPLYRTTHCFDVMTFQTSRSGSRMLAEFQRCRLRGARAQEKAAGSLIDGPEIDIEDRARGQGEMSDNGPCCPCDPSIPGWTIRKGGGLWRGSS